jgi:hypothetical protein
MGKLKNFSLPQSSRRGRKNEKGELQIVFSAARSIKVEGKIVETCHKSLECFGGSSPSPPHGELQSQITSQSQLMKLLIKSLLAAQILD